ncbi:MAG: DNA replication/repair protein RecF [Peptoniphilaceae bacterium]|nr:DNA replication/repair protein RecF [Peptoniphilaceae bacterium]MDY6085311.1 DNA replication/repair protein RecF [Peptoniphilaceae bacterium]
MTLKALALINFRNYAYQKLEFYPGCHVFYGDNAQGKTNLLESIYLSARGHSFKARRDREMIRFGERSLYVLTRIENASRSREIETKISMVEKKRVRINRVDIGSSREVNELFDVVLFAPEHLELVQGSPGERRRFMDDLLNATQTRYHATLSIYEKVLYQRNQLVKRKPKWMMAQLDALDQQLAHAMIEIVHQRRKLLERLETDANAIHQELSRHEERLRFTYKTEIGEDMDYNLQVLRQSRERDLRERYTHVGPQRDDFLITINDTPARLFASQGQSRSITLSCKLAELFERKRVSGKAPLLLLDDAFSELDDTRAAKLLEVIRPFQSVITTNQAGFLRQHAPEAHFYHVVDGHAREERGVE